MLWFRTPEKIYIKRGCLPVALDEIKNVLGKKRVFIVTDNFLYKNGLIKPITDKLDEMGVVYTTFFDVEPDPTLACAREGAKAMRDFEPDCIIAVGGGSPMDAAKIMWVLYEHPDADFEDMAMRFADIRKRIYTFPKMGEKAYFIAIPTTAVRLRGNTLRGYHRRKTGVKYPLADWAASRYGNSRFKPYDEYAEEPYCCIGHRCSDSRRRGIRLNAGDGIQTGPLSRQ